MFAGLQDLTPRSGLKRACKSVIARPDPCGLLPISLRFRLRSITVQDGGL